jgi:hypothetical protein
VHESGLAGYYRIKDDITTPADSAVFQPRDYAWLEDAQRAVEAEPGVPELTLDVQGISCAACVWLIERVFQQLPGAREIIVNAQYGSMRLRWVSGRILRAGVRATATDVRLPRQARRVKSRATPRRASCCDGSGCARPSR